MFGYQWQYAVKGRYCLYHILKALKIKGPCLLPVYACSSLLEPFKRLGISYSFYDISPDDLNGDVNSLKEMIDLYKPDSVLAVSMYGNPCQLDKIERLCKENSIMLIDDAAQSYGALVAGQKVGEFGDAGFVSFSPGKPLAAHMGGFFRLNIDYHINRTHHTLLHKLIYKDFITNRYANSRKNGKWLNKLIFHLQKIINIQNDGIDSFEEGILSGVFNNSNLIWTPFRTKLASMMKEGIYNNTRFTVLAPYSDDYRKGIAHKYIVIAKDKGEAVALNDYLHKNMIASQFGYKLLTDDLDKLPNAKRIEGRIVEIPLDPDMNLFEYIKQILNNYITYDRT